MASSFHPELTTDTGSTHTSSTKCAQREKLQLQMSRARRLLPTDLVALALRRAPERSEAMDRIGLIERGRVPRGGARTVVLLRDRQADLRQREGRDDRGLINARPRGKRTAWEIEALIDADEDKRVVASLFSRMLEGPAGSAPSVPSCASMPTARWSGAPAMLGSFHIRRRF